jgi:hypothetical protein
MQLTSAVESSSSSRMGIQWCLMAFRAAISEKNTSIGIDAFRVIAGRCDNKFTKYCSSNEFSPGEGDCRTAGSWLGSCDEFCLFHVFPARAVSIA